MYWSKGPEWYITVYGVISATHIHKEIKKISNGSIYRDTLYYHYWSKGPGGYITVCVILESNVLLKKIWRKGSIFLKTPSTINTGQRVQDGILLFMCNTSNPYP